MILDNSWRVTNENFERSINLYEFNVGEVNPDLVPQDYSDSVNDTESEFKKIGCQQK